MMSVEPLKDIYTTTQTVKLCLKPIQGTFILCLCCVVKIFSSASICFEQEGKKHATIFAQDFFGKKNIHLLLTLDC